MRVNCKIKSLVDNLLATHLILGVQPSALADSAFENNYKSIEITNKNDIVEVLLTFLDHDDEEGSVVVVMRYTYNADKKLMRIEQKLGRCKFITQWDRERTVNGLIAELELHLSTMNSTEDVQRTIAHLPSDLKTGINQLLKIAV